MFYPNINWVEWSFTKSSTQFYLQCSTLLFLSPTTAKETHTSTIQVKKEHNRLATRTLRADLNGHRVEQPTLTTEGSSSGSSIKVYESNIRRRIETERGKCEIIARLIICLKKE